MTKGERTVVLAIFTPNVAVMEYVFGCGMDMEPGMLQLVPGDWNDTWKPTSFLSVLEIHADQKEEATLCYYGPWYTGTAQVVL